MKKHLLGTLFLFLLFVSCSKEETESKIEIKEPETEEPGDDNNNSVVLADNTIQFTQELVNHVSEVTGSNFTFDSSVEEAKLPKVGQVLLVSEISEKFPNGFLGKVTQITKESGGYKIQTEPASLKEAFKELILDDEIDFVPLEDNPQTRSTFSKDEDGYYCAAFPCSGKWEALTLAGRTECGLKMVRKGNFLTNDFECTVYLKMNVNSEFGVSAKKDFELKVKPFFSKPLRAVGGIVTAIITPVFELKPLLQVEGSCNLKFKGELEQIFVGGFSYINGEIQMGDKKVPGEKRFTLGLSENISLHGEAFIGLGGNVKLALLGSDIISVGLETKLGPKLSADLDFNITASNLYESLKDTKATTSLYCGMDLVAKADLFPLKDKNDKDDEKEGNTEVRREFFGLDLLLEDKYLFPSFDDMSVEVNEDKQDAKVSTTVKRNLLFENVKVGMKLYDKDNAIISVSKSVPYYKEKEFQSPWEVLFTSLKVNKKHYVRPCVELFGKSFTATPTKDFKVEKFPVGTWRNTYVEWKERLLSDSELTSRKEEVNKIIVFLANGRLGTLDNLGNVIESSTDTYQYDKSVKKMTITVYDAEDKKMVTDTMDVEITSDGFTLTNHWIDEDMESYTINTFVKVE